VGTDDDSDASSATDAVDAEKVDRETRHDLEEEAAFLRNELSQFDGTVESDQDDSKKDDSALQDDVNKLQAELNTKGQKHRMPSKTMPKTSHRTTQLQLSQRMQSTPLSWRTLQRSMRKNISITMASTMIPLC